MTNYFIYLAGGMGSLSFEEQNEWRVDLKQRFAYYYKSYYKSRFYNVVFINPVDYYNFEEKRHETEDEVMRFDLHKVKTSDLVIVNFNDPKSIGTTAEMATAYDRGIPIIGLNESGVELHPWLRCMTERIFTDRGELLDYISSFYLN